MTGFRLSTEWAAASCQGLLLGMFDFVVVHLHGHRIGAVIGELGIEPLVHGFNQFGTH
jgi:hypothetical protein